MATACRSSAVGTGAGRSAVRGTTSTPTTPGIGDARVLRVQPGHAVRAGEQRAGGLQREQPVVGGGHGPAAGAQLLGAAPDGVGSGSGSEPPTAG